MHIVRTRNLAIVASGHGGANEQRLAWDLLQKYRQQLNCHAYRASALSALYSGPHVHRTVCNLP
jgi:hypothetical protein